MNGVFDETPVFFHETLYSQTYILNYALWLKKEGYSPDTIKNRVKVLRRIVSNSGSLLDGEAVKDYVAKSQTKGSTKLSIVNIYYHFAKWKGFSWEKPKVQNPEPETPFIPLESELDALISGSGKKLSTFLLFLKETGARCGEIWRLKWTDLDTEAGTVNIRAEKKSNSRTVKLCAKLLAMLNRLPREGRTVKDPKLIFGGTTLEVTRINLHHARRVLALKLQNPRLERVHFHTFRHWKATATYHRTKDILFTQKVLGHKSLTSTLRYTQLVNWESEDGFHCRVAKNSSEARELVEGGWEYVATTPEPEKVMVFRKRK